MVQAPPHLASPPSDTFLPQAGTVLGGEETPPERRGWLLVWRCHRAGLTRGVHAAMRLESGTTAQTDDLSFAWELFCLDPPGAMQSGAVAGRGSAVAAARRVDRAVRLHRPCLTRSHPRLTEEPVAGDRAGTSAHRPARAGCPLPRCIGQLATTTCFSGERRSGGQVRGSLHP